MQIDILTFEDVQKTSEQFDIPYTASISKWLVELLNAYFNINEATVVLCINIELLPKTYQEHSWMWLKKFEKSFFYPTIFSSKHGERLFITAFKDCNIAKPLSYVKLLKNHLLVLRRVIFRTSEIPPSHQKQPYVLVSRLRPYFKNLTVSTLKNKTIYTHEGRTKLNF